MPVQATGISITVTTMLPQLGGKSKQKLKNILEQTLQTGKKCGILTMMQQGAEKEGPMAQMTRMQQKIYDYIAQMLAQEGYPPSVREIGAAVGLKSPSTVHFHLKHMEEKGIIKKAGRKGRTITLVQPPVQQETAAPQMLEEEPPVGRVPLWEQWRPVRRFWRRSVSRIIWPLTPADGTASILPCGCGASPC